MAERRDQGFEVAPTRLVGPGEPGRSRRRPPTPMLIVIALAVLVPAVAFVGPRIEWRPEVDLTLLLPPTPAPSPTPPRRSFAPGIATPLPIVSIGAAPHPTEPFAVDVGGLRLADPATGKLGPPMGPRGDNDAIFTLPGGAGWWCLCISRTSTSDSESATVEIRRFDSSGGEVHRQGIGGYKSVAASPANDVYTRFDVELSPDRRTAWMTSATRNGSDWLFAMEAIDLETGAITARTELGSLTIPSIAAPTPSPDGGRVDHYLVGPVTRLTPDGRRILVMAWIESYFDAGPVPPAAPNAWLVDLDPANRTIGPPGPLDRSFVERLRACYGIAWSTDQELAAICWRNADATPTASLKRLTMTGEELGSIEIVGTQGFWVANPVLDRANRLVYLWLPTEHVLRRIDLDRMQLDELKVDPAATVVGPSGSGPRASPATSGTTPEWDSFGSSFRMYYSPQLVAEPGGNRLFALGILTDESNGYSPSSGIWVLDGVELAVLDRWAAVAAYGSIGLSSDGRWLQAVGNAGVDAEGKPSSWQTSITIHDVFDGHLALQLGSLGTDEVVLQVPP